MSPTNGFVEHLRELAHQRSVVFEVWPEYLMVGNQRRQVGFEVDVCGKLTGANEDWYSAYKDLREIADYVLATKDNEHTKDTNCTFEVLPFDEAIHEAPVNQLRPEVEVAVKVLHRTGFDQPVDNCEEICIRNLEAKLRLLGISKR